MLAFPWKRISPVMWCRALMCRFLCLSKTAPAVHTPATLLPGSEGFTLAAVAKNFKNSGAVVAHSSIIRPNENETNS